MSQKEISNPAENVFPDAVSSSSKKDQVADMFNDIAGKYDFLNHFLSLGIDKGWRKKAIKAIAAIRPLTLLDIATGTGDLAIAASKINPEKVVGIDISEGMLAIGKRKVRSMHLDNIITLQQGDSEALEFPDNSFDAITCAFGVRNFEHLTIGLKEMNRVVKPGGKIAILEFSHPKHFPIKQLYQFYFKSILPTLGKLVSSHRNAYTYLPESVMAFPEGATFCNILKECGFKEVAARTLTFGICTLYVATK